MDVFRQLFNNALFLIAASFVAGVLTQTITYRLLNKRALFTYNVFHNRVGVSANDPLFGTIQVLYNDTPLNNLYASTITIKNASLKDFDDITLIIYGYETTFLIEQTRIVGTPHILKLTDQYIELLKKANAQDATDNDKILAFKQREYTVPILNRGQEIRIDMLNTADTSGPPQIAADISKKGIRLVEQPEPTLFLGVPDSAASAYGVLLGLIFFTTVIVLVDTLWIAALLMLIYGVGVKLPGAALILIGRKIRSYIGE